MCDEVSKVMSSLHIFTPVGFQAKTIEDLLKYIDSNFKQVTNPQHLLPVIHQVVKLSEANGGDITLHIRNLIASHTDEAELIVVLQIIYQILKSLDESKEKRALKFNSDSLLKLLDVLMTSDNRILNANILACLQLYTQKFQTNVLIENLWGCCVASNYEEGTLQRTAQILVQLFDEFTISIENFQHNEQLLEIIQELLCSQRREQRKSAYFLIKKVLDALNTAAEKILAWEIGNFTAYVSINENLEENQSHLILPALEILHTIEVRGVFWEKWMNILYMRILSHSNILVVRWSIEYFIRTFTCAELEFKLLQQFLVCTNNTRLYDGEACLLIEENVPKFLQCDSSKFVSALAEVNLKPVPLKFWLRMLNDYGTFMDSVDAELLLRIATRVRTLPDANIRQGVIKSFHKLFGYKITKMNLHDYMTLIESLYNVSDITDPFTQWDQFITKLDQCSNFLTSTQRFYELLTHNVNMQPQRALHLFELLAKRLSIQPKGTHGWWRFVIIFHFDTTKPEVREFCRKHYDIDLTAMIEDVREETSLNHIISQSVEKLGGSKAEDAVVFEKTLDFLVENCLHTFSDHTKLGISLDDCIDRCSLKTLVKLSELAANSEDVLEEETFDALFDGISKRRLNMKNLPCVPYAHKFEENLIPLFQRRLPTAIEEENLQLSLPPKMLEALRELRKDMITPEFAPSLHVYKIFKNLLTYCKNMLTPEMASSRAEQILNLDFENFDLTLAVLQSGIEISSATYMRGILLKDTKIGFEREHSTRMKYLENILTKDLKSDIMLHLISLNNEISEKRPRYYENCKEHRLKIRIVRSLLDMCIRSNARMLIHSYDNHTPPIDAFWNILLEQNNQINVTLCYEYLIAKCSTNSDMILQKLKEVPKFTPSQQVSVISVTHSYCLFNMSKIVHDPQLLNEIVQRFMTLTMGANFQTRLFAQLSTYSILKTLTKNRNIKFSTIVANTPQLLTIIEEAIGEKLLDLMEDVRLKFLDISLVSYSKSFDILMYITQSAEDEYCSLAEEAEQKFRNSRNLFRKKIDKTCETVTQNVDLPNVFLGHIQRKMNPTGDILVKHTLKTYSDCQPNEMHICASLIDKLPNLGGIARTCEVLGIQNLVIKSKSVTDKNDFKNLSMTAEKSLNIIEVKPSALVDFLIQKRTEGFKIVGAEQCATSLSFTNFEFPKRCVLLLGHEKDGIPSNLLGFLDYAVEIPQFGMVRSLNVHVTAALFMWEFCKQHLIKP